MTVYLPQYIVGHWWESLLHNHQARRIASSSCSCTASSITLVPWLLDSSELIYGRRSRPLPGQERRGEPVRPVAPPHRRPMGPHGFPLHMRGTHGGADALNDLRPERTTGASASPESEAVEEPSVGPRA